MTERFQPNSAHTPTPWAVREDEATKIEDANGNMIGMLSQTHLRGRREPGEASANAAVIVKAINNHDRLVEALRDILAICDHAESYTLTHFADKIETIAYHAVAEIKP